MCLFSYALYDTPTSETIWGALGLYPLWETVSNSPYSVYGLEEVLTPDENVKMTKMKVHSDEQLLCKRWDLASSEKSKAWILQSHTGVWTLHQLWPY